jgi:hypothetical protein
MNTTGLVLILLSFVPIMGTTGIGMIDAFQNDAGGPDELADRVSDGLWCGLASFPILVIGLTLLVWGFMRSFRS